MIKTFTLLIVLFISSLSTFCQSYSTIGLTEEFNAPKGPNEIADKVYFIKLGKYSRITEIDSIIKSNYQKDNHIYLKGVEPGRYAIVAIGKEKYLPIYGKTELTTYLSENLIIESIVTVKANDFVYIGSYDFKTKMLKPNKKNNETQYHFFKTITGKVEVPTYMKQTRSDNWHYKTHYESIEKTDTITNDFMLKALGHFNGTEQEVIIRNKIEEKTDHNNSL